MFKNEGKKEMKEEGKDSCAFILNYSNPACVRI
jgi:hypothetical protein